MKKIVFFLSLFLFIGVAANAQSSCCKKAGKDKACAKSEKASAKSDKANAETKVASAYMEAANALAESDPAIKKRVCAQSGAVSYYQKSKCAESGKVSWDEVEYNVDEKKFTKVAAAFVEKDMEADAKPSKAKKACCSKKGEKSCSKKAGA